MSRRKILMEAAANLIISIVLVAAVYVTVMYLISPVEAAEVSEEKLYTEKEVQSLLDYQKVAARTAFLYHLVKVCYEGPGGRLYVRFGGDDNRRWVVKCIAEQYDPVKHLIKRKEKYAGFKPEVPTR
jgi:hypothetical protein